MFKTSLLVASLALAMSANATTLTRDNGAPVGDNQNSTTAGETGSVLLQDMHLIQKLQRFGRERIPERVVHARGTGVHGVFTSTADLSENTMAAPLQQAGIDTPVVVRFSTVVHGKGSPETLRDPRGFATKFYSEGGNWDLVGNNLPVFFIRDAKKFPDMVHAFKPSPVTNVQDPNRVFDFLSTQPSATHMLTQVYSNLGVPASYRQMDGFGVHSYKFVNAKGEVRYVKFHWKSHQGIKSLRPNEIAKVQGMDFNHLTNDLYGEIEKGNFPKWDLMVKVLTPSELAGLDYNGLDATKVWLDVPEKKVGTMTLNRVPDNFFQESEQSAFAPSNVIAGIEPSEDRLLQGRVFSYADTQMYRLGANHTMLPINAPKNGKINYNQDGAGNHGNTTSDVNYQPSNHVELSDDAQYKVASMPLNGTTQSMPIKAERNFYQAGVFWNSLSNQGKKDLITNLSGDLGKVEDKLIQAKMLSYFYKADSRYGERLTKAVGADIKQVKQLASKL